MQTNQIDKVAIDEQNQREADIEEVMNTKAGQRIIHWILKEGRIFLPCFTGNSKTFYNLGARELALRLFTLVTKVCPGQFYQSHTEILRKEAEYAKRRRDTVADTDEH